MNQTDRAELNELRSAMWEIFQKVARTPENDPEIGRFIGIMDRHQEILSGDVERRDEE